MEEKEYSINELREYVKSKDIIDILIDLEIIDEDDMHDRKMSCVFHDEKTPSLMFYEDNYHCFGCGAHGDVIKFIQDTYDISYFQAFEMIAERYGFKIKHSRISSNPFLAHDRMNDSINRKSLEEEWEGYLSSAKEIKDEDKKKFISSVFPLEVGFDKKINYFVFRYTSKTNKTLGFTKRRAFDVEEGGSHYPKWKHSSTKDSFINECANMYNLGNAIKYIRDKKRVILVEGPKDVIPWILTNNKEVVAISGTHNKDKVFSTLPKVDKVVLSLDGDNAGRKGSVDIASYLSTKMSLEDITYIPYNGLDPYDYYQKNNSIPDEENILELFEESELKKIYNNSSLFNKDLIAKYVSEKKHVNYDEARSFLEMNIREVNNSRKKSEDEYNKLTSSNDPDAMKKLAIKYGLE